jgi:hypothetical protein
MIDLVAGIEQDVMLFKLEWLEVRLSAARSFGRNDASSKLPLSGMFALPCHAGGSAIGLSATDAHG